MTYRDFLEGCLQDLNIIGAGEIMTGEDGAFALVKLNDFIDALALEGLTIPTIGRVTWTLGNGTASYTVGLTQTVNIDKPVNAQSISNIGYIDTTVTPNQEFLFGRVVTTAEWEAIAQKTFSATRPTRYYYDPTFGTTGTLWVFPIPNVSTLNGVIYAPTLLAEVALTDTVSLPRGYRTFFRDNLTIKLAAAFEKTAPAAIVASAYDAKCRVKAANVPMTDLALSQRVPGLGRHAAYNIITDN